MVLFAHFQIYIQDHPHCSSVQGVNSLQILLYKARNLVEHRAAMFGNTIGQEDFLLSDELEELLIQSEAKELLRLSVAEPKYLAKLREHPEIYALYGD